MRRSAISRVTLALAVFVAARCIGAPAGEEPKAWTFAAFADNRSAHERPKDSFEGVLTEIRTMTANPDRRFAPIEFAVGVGDIKLSADNHKNWDLWLRAFEGVTNAPAFFPVIGNWDAGDEAFSRSTVLPAQRGVVGKDPANYYADWKNVRVIVSEEAAFVESAIQSAPTGIAHVFVANHYPVFPRHEYAAKPSAKGVEYWNTLLKHKDRVRALLVGHTHTYSRMRVANPLGDAQDPKSFPNEQGGIYQIDCGNAGRSGHGDPATTIVEVLVDGGNLAFRVVQAPNATPFAFKVVDAWTIQSASGGTK